MVGMCLTGGFALGMMVDDTVVAPVVSQPGLPFPVSAARKRVLGISDGDLRRVQERAAAGTCVLGLRFSGDTSAPLNGSTISERRWATSSSPSSFRFLAGQPLWAQEGRTRC